MGMAGSIGAEAAQVVEDFFRALESGDWARVRLILHPYLHWVEGESALRGRNGVFERLAARPAPAAPTAIELRDGQIYRWYGPEGH